MTDVKQVSLVLRRRTTDRIVVDGHDITNMVGAVMVHADPCSVPHVQLDLPVLDLMVNTDATVSIPENLAQALVALGWTPPEPDGS